MADADDILLDNAVVVGFKATIPEFKATDAIHESISTEFLYTVYSMTLSSVSA